MAATYTTADLIVQTMLCRWGMMRLPAGSWLFITPELRFASFAKSLAMAVLDSQISALEHEQRRERGVIDG